jgi:hypothetical protein
MKPKKNEPEQPLKKKLWAAADKLRKNMERARTKSIMTDKLKGENTNWAQLMRTSKEKK